MMVLAVGEDALDVPVQGLHEPDPSMHQRAATFGRHDQHLDGCLPFLVYSPFRPQLERSLRPLCFNVQDV